MSSSRHTLTTSDDERLVERSSPVVIPHSPPAWTSYPGGGSRGLLSYLEIPFMHKRLIIACTLLGILVGWLAILVWPRVYESEARLKIKAGRENLGLDPTATTGSALLSLQKSQDEEISSALEILNSRMIAETVVDKLGVDVVLDGQVPGATEGDDDRRSEENGFAARFDVARSQVKGWISDLMKHAGIREDLSKRENAVRKIQSAVDIDAPKRSSILIIEGNADSPEMAQVIVREVTSAFVDEQLRGAHTEGSYEFFLGQSTDVEKQLSDLIAERAAFMQETKVVSLENNRQMLSSQLGGIDRDLALASGNLEQAIAEVDDIKAKLNVTDDEVVAQRQQGSDDTWSGMRQQVYALELEEQKLAASFTEAHPKLRRVRTQLRGAREILSELESIRVDESTTPNPIKTGLLEELQAKQTLVVGLRSNIKEKRSQRAELEKEARELLEKERRLTHLDREIALKSSNLTMLREKLEEARVIKGLHNEKFSNIHVFQPASLVEKAVRPKKQVVGAGFAFFGLMTGLALSFLREGLSPKIRTREDVESRLGVPVVSTVPRLKKPNLLRLQNKRVYRKTCQEVMAHLLMTQPQPRGIRGRSLGIIGVDSGAGASTLAVNLAITSDVDCRLKTVLVDADSRQRSVSRMFGLNGSPGLVELMSGASSHDECVQKTTDADVDLIAYSSDTSDQLLSSTPDEIVTALEAYLRDCDLLIVDLPAASQPDHAIALAGQLDYTLVVAESEKTQATSTDRLLNRLSQTNTEIIGVVLTKTRSYLPRFVRSFVGQ